MLWRGVIIGNLYTLKILAYQNPCWTVWQVCYQKEGATDRVGILSICVTAISAWLKLVVYQALYNKILAC